MRSLGSTRRYHVLDGAAGHPLSMCASVFSSRTSRNSSSTAITLSSCNGASVSVPWVRPLCLASRHNAQQGKGIVDHLLLHGAQRQQVVRIHDGSIFVAHYLRHRNWALHDLWLVICVRICGTGMATSSTWSGVFTAISCHGLTTHGSATMRDFDVSCAVSWDHCQFRWCAVLWRVLCELSTASLADQARVFCGY